MLKNNFFKSIPVPVVIVISWILIGMLVFHYLEDWTWAQCFYFSVVTLTTVGYGDFSPTTEVSRFFTAVYILVGVTIALGAFGVIGTNYLETKEADRKNKIEK